MRHTCPTCYVRLRVNCIRYGAVYDPETSHSLKFVVYKYYVFFFFYVCRFPNVHKIIVIDTNCLGLCVSIYILYI